MGGRYRRQVRHPGGLESLSGTIHVQFTPQFHRRGLGLSHRPCAPLRPFPSAPNASASAPPPSPGARRSAKPPMRSQPPAIRAFSSAPTPSRSSSPPNSSICSRTRARLRRPLKRRTPARSRRRSRPTRQGHRQRQVPPRFRPPQSPDPGPTQALPITHEFVVRFR